MTGQMTLFDFVSDEDKAEFDVHYPNVGEYDKELKLAFEKEVLGIYISGHPLEEYEKFLTKNVTAVTTDFYLDEDTAAIRYMMITIMKLVGTNSRKKLLKLSLVMVLRLLEIMLLIMSLI